MNKNILKYFGLAALLALGVQTAEAATVAKIGTTEYESLAVAFAAATDGCSIDLLAGVHDMKSKDALAVFGGKKVTLRGAGRDITSIDFGTGTKGCDSNLDITFENLTLNFKHDVADSTGNLVYNECLQHPKAQSFRNVKINGMFTMIDDATFDGCVFAGSADGERDAATEYLLWNHAGVLTLTDCVFEKSGTKAPIKIYAEAGYNCSLIITSTVFNEIGSKGCAIYSSNTNNGGNDVVYVVTYYDCTLPEGKNLVTDSGKASTITEAKPAADNVVEVISADGTTTKGYPTLAEAFAATSWVDKPVNGCTVRLLADIDLAGVAWTPVSFCGTFDGNNKTISNLYVNVNTHYAGFFSMFRGTARNVTFEDADVTGSKYAAVFAANVSNAGGASDDNLKMLIEGVTIKNSTVKGEQKCGGVIGQFSQSNGSIEIRGCLVDTLSIGGDGGVWQAGGLVGHLQTGTSEDAYIHDNTVRNITIADANVECFETEGYYHQFFSGAFIGNVINYHFDGGAKDGTVVLENNTVGGTNGGYQIGPKSNTYVGDYYTQDEVGGSISKVCKIEVDGVDITIPASPEVVPEKPTEEKAKEATKVVDESGAVVTPTQEQEAAAKTEVDKVAQSFDNPEIAKVETHVTEAAMTVSGEGEEQKVVVKSAIVEELQKAAPAGATDQITSESDVTSYVKVALNEAKVAVKEEGAALKSVTFDVKPMAETTVTVGQEKKVVVAQIPNEEIAKPITFRLPLTDAFTVSAIVTHEGDPDRLCMVQGVAGGRYVEVTASHFSLFTATPSEIVETTTESKTVLGIKRVDYTVTQSTADLAAAVPWLMAAEENMPVSGLITTGLSVGDQIQVYEKSANAYYSWLYQDGEWRTAASSGAPSADEYKLERGRAFWYKPAANKIGVTGTYTQVGLYSEAAITSKVDSATVASASFANPVHFLMASPKYEDFNLKEKLTAAAGCVDDDVVVIVATGARYRFNGTVSVWGQDKVVEKKSRFDGTTYKTTEFEAATGDIVVPAGTAFWYLSAGGAPEFEW